MGQDRTAAGLGCSAARRGPRPVAGTRPPPEPPCYARVSRPARPAARWPPPGWTVRGRSR
ncbi:hypothetical protein FXF53_09340 [Micromonospora sp. WP24]|nr:hypothetical protein FXF53_09340 [Micromonospora sp. WP24]